MAFVVIFLVVMAGVIIWSARQKKEEDAAIQSRIDSQQAVDRSLQEMEADTDEWRKEFKDKFGVDPLSDIAPDEYDDWCSQHDADIYGYSIAGINFRKLDDSHTGPFDGTLQIEPDNPHDSKAVAIFRGRKKVGYIPKEYNEDVFDCLLKMGGHGPCIGYIHTFFDDEGKKRFAGKVIFSPSQIGDSSQVNSA